MFLNACDSDLEANGVRLCRDRANVDREAVHGRLGAIIRGFFDERL